jgi:hypothetical protein
MNASNLSQLLPTLMRELVFGSPDPSDRTYITNRGDAGMLASLDRLSASAASFERGGPSIAAHVDHLRYGLSLLNKWSRGEPITWQETDWTRAWKKGSVTDDEWQSLRDELRSEATEWIEALSTPREVTDIEAGWMAGSVAHVAYHLGSIRQLDRAARGPTAEDERKAEAALQKK